tara:strand:- start:466 stop:1242 length:777 start_codon:yes stop_codon:yes gene_type:complete
MASMARSGETLVLKVMAAHSKIVVIHNLESTDSKQDLRTFRFFKSYKKTVIRASHRAVSRYGLKENQVLLLKQGVWEHRYPFNGFVLVRNPVSIYSSLKAYDRNDPKYDPEENFWFKNEERLSRWLKDMSPSLLRGFDKLAPVQQFALFYNYRMNHLASLGLPIIRYEDLVTDPENTFAAICRSMNLPFEKEMLHAHEDYGTDVKGHGDNLLSRPVDSTSLIKYKQNVSLEEFAECSDLTESTQKKFGYVCDDGQIKY